MNINRVILLSPYSKSSSFLKKSCRQLISVRSFSVIGNERVSVVLSMLPFLSLVSISSSALPIDMLNNGLLVYFDHLQNQNINNILASICCNNNCKNSGASCCVFCGAFKSCHPRMQKASGSTTACWVICMVLKGNIICRNGARLIILLSRTFK